MLREHYQSALNIKDASQLLPEDVKNIFIDLMLFLIDDNDDDSFMAVPYVEEWAARFKTGEPDRFMSPNTLVKYIELKNKYSTIGETKNEQ